MCDHLGIGSGGDAADAFGPPLVVAEYVLVEIGLEVFHADG